MQKDRCGRENLKNSAETLEEMHHVMFDIVENVLSKLEPDGEAFFFNEDEYDDE